MKKPMSDLEKADIRLSSLMTFYFKVIFPTFWLTGFTLGTVAMFVKGFEEARIFAIMLFIATIFLLLTCFPLKKVIATNEGLIVSNYCKEALIPYSEILSLYEIKTISGHPIVVFLKTQGIFGKRFMFTPYTYFALWPLRKHPAAKLIWDRIGKAGAPISPR